jgi:CubicO group peptidase (beta-lactamase class C family)
MKSRLVRFILIFYLILLPCTGIASSALAQETASTANFAAIDAFVESKLNDANLPGLALGIVHGDQIVHLQGFGIADPSGREVTPQTPFRLASVTKSFTALAIMQLVETGMLELDAPVQQYLPWFRVGDADASAHITVRHLLNQTSGFSMQDGIRDLDAPDTGPLDAENYVRGLSNAELAYPVGEDMLYSNANYITLGVIVESVSGTSYERYLQENLLRPLDMQNTFMSEVEAQPHNMARGYQPFFGIQRPYEFTVRHAALAAGGIISTAEDMAHYLKLYLNQGHYGDVSLLSPDGIAQLWQAPDDLPHEQMLPYAMGWYVGTQFDTYVRHHWGNTVNFTAYMAVAPNEGWGVVVLVNADHPALVSPAVIDVIGPGVLTMLLDQPLPESLNQTGSIYYGILIIVVLQILSLIWGLFWLRRWSLEPQRRPYGWWRVVLGIVLPILLNLMFAYLFVFVLPQAIGSSLGIVLRLVTDMGIGLVLSGVIGAGWLVWGIAVFVVLRQASAPPAAMPERLVTETIR